MTLKPLDEAIRLHQVHMDKPKTATMQSQRQLMDLLKKAKAQLLEGHKRMMGMSHKAME